MSRVAFLFPGQGSQYVGMGKEMADHFSEAREIFAQADDCLNMNLSEVCFEGPKNVLQQTVNTQPAILTTSMACYRVLISAGISPDQVAGHSLGEHSALVAAGSIGFADAVKLVQQRGKWMQEAAGEGRGGMAAILGLSASDVVKVCKQAESWGVVQPANFNCPGQVVISGEQKSLEKAMEIAKEMGAKRVVPLTVSGPFHSTLIETAGEKLSSALEGISLNMPNVPLVANVTADYIKDLTDLKRCIVKQVSSPVRWEESIRRMIDDDVTIFVEVGPGKVLRGLVRKINKNVTCLNVEDSVSCEKTLDYLKGVL